MIFLLSSSKFPIIRLWKKRVRYNNVRWGDRCNCLFVLVFTREREKKKGFYVYHSCQGRNLRVFAWLALPFPIIFLGFHFHFHWLERWNDTSDGLVILQPSNQRRMLGNLKQIVLRHCSSTIHSSNAKPSGIFRPSWSWEWDCQFWPPLIAILIL